MRLQSKTARKASWMVVPLLLCLGSVVALSNPSAGCGDNLADCPTRLATADALSPLAVMDGGVHAELALLGEDILLGASVTPASPTPTKHMLKPKPKSATSHKKPSKTTEEHKKPPKRTTEPHKKPPKTTEPHKKVPSKSKSHPSEGHDDPTPLTPPPKESHKPKPKPKPKPHEPTHPHNTSPHHPPHTSAVAPSPSSTDPLESPASTIVASTGTSGESVPTTTDAGTTSSLSLDPTITPTTTADVGTTVQSPPAVTAPPSSAHNPSPSPTTVVSVPTPDPATTSGIQTPHRPTLPPSPSPSPSPTTTVTTTEHTPKATTAAPAPVTTTTTTTTTAGATVPTTTAAPNPNSSVHHTRPTKTTPWLPPTIEPVTPPKTIHTAPPGTSLPDVVIPDLHPDIPGNSIKVHMRFERVSYYQVINNGILAAQLVSFIPAQLCQLLDVDCELIMVLAIRDGSNVTSISTRKLKKRRNSSELVEADAPKDQDSSRDGAAHVLLRRDGNNLALLEKRGLVTTNNAADAILVTVAIPQAQYWNLNSLLTNPKSALFTVGATNFGQFLDSTFPLSSQPPPVPDSQDGDDDGGDSTADPLTGGNPDSVVTNPGDTLSTNSAPVIGSVVGLAAIAYVGVAMFVVRRQREKKRREHEAAEATKAKISAPVNVQDSTQGWGWHSS